MKKFYVKPTLEVIETECESCFMIGSLGTSEKPADGGTSVLSNEDDDTEVNIGYLQSENWL